MIGNDAAYRAAQQSWLEACIRAAKGTRRSAIVRGLSPDSHAFLRNVWWPALRSFEHLEPLVAARDADGELVLDFAYMRPPLTIGIDIGSGRRPLGGACRAVDVAAVLRFAAEDVRRDAARCREALRFALERTYGATEPPALRLSPNEKEIARLAARSVRPITPADVARELLVCGKTARSALKQLVYKRLLRAAGGGKQRIRAYEPAIEKQRLLRMLG
ncbi:hypothetical protein [Paenibacillus sp.]|uniref:hypothetical protein n=1 Tax=Paenibacillus sp. TaxID=58172 RepID=UPI002D44AC87|nr:hypothetical protein [Paenibacillus sp.]HZG55416.1 hypothetical protein [Paenibacillus sp.]